MSQLNCILTEPHKCFGSLDPSSGVGYRDFKFITKRNSYYTI
jgi:hypothetical protein